MSKKNSDEDGEKLVKSLQLLDPLLQFLTKSTGRTVVSLLSLRTIIPVNKRSVLEDIPKLVAAGVLQMEVQNDLKGEIDYILGGKEENVEKVKVIMVGFPSPFDHFSIAVGANQNRGQNKVKSTGPGLHGSTKTAARRRLSALKRYIKTTKSSLSKKSGVRSKKAIEVGSTSTDPQICEKVGEEVDHPQLTRGIDPSLLDGMVNKDIYQKYTVKEQHEKMKLNMNVNHGEMTKEGKAALRELELFFGRSRDINKNEDNNKSKEVTKTDETFILKNQAAYAGSRDKRQTKYSFLSQKYVDMVPLPIRDAFGLQLSSDGIEEQQSLAYRALDAHKGSLKRRMLYSHQAKAIEAALNLKHTLVCTGTGSGKSMCFLIPLLADVMTSDMEQSSEDKTTREECFSPGKVKKCKRTTALIMFPTKALAQDQLTKLETLVKSSTLMQKHIRPGIIDGDTPHQNRSDIAEHCNIILTNPDTLHAAIIPGWKVNYRNLFARLRYIVIDELHTYEGAFGAHVSLVLSRLVRVSKVAKCTAANPQIDNSLVFICCSATIGHPDEHFRLICPIAKSEDVKVISAEEDGSPCAAKHFFVWNPPLLGSSGEDTGYITVPLRNKNKEGAKETLRKRKRGKKSARARSFEKASFTDNPSNFDGKDQYGFAGIMKRRHAADETAKLLAHAVSKGIRSIAFCKTRMLAEWVYESCVSIIKSDESTAKLSDKVEIYRGGYSASIRRNIEAKLFKNELYGVVGTSALELGIDLGGIDLTLHCGYPGSIASLLQQAGRAGRGAATQGASFAIMVCFSSPSEQHIWRRPKGLLGRGLDAPPSIPLNVGIVQGHLLCASEEFPICGDHYHSVTDILYGELGHFTTDSDLFGGKDVYQESLENLFDSDNLQLEVVSGQNKFNTYTKHPSIDKPSLQVSLRNIEPINYSIVDMSHPRQANRNDGIHDKAAIMDTIPYSRVFYHAYPGAIIMHRGIRYKIHSMTAPPAFASVTGCYRYNCSDLGAYAKPSQARYSTRALSITLITIVKQLDRIELEPPQKAKNKKLGGIELPGKKMQATSDEKVVVENQNSTEEQKDRTCDKTEVTREKIDPGITETEGQFEPPLSLGTLAGNGVVTVKRTVHGYKKLSLVNRVELSRSEISLPPMEYDTNAMWIDTEAAILAELMPDYDKGVHALSHAIVAVAPLFVPCTSSDLDCDHSHYGCTRITLFDVRAGGSGTSAHLWKHFFRLNGVMDAAIDLLSECPANCDSGSYKGGCPGCIQAIPCINFHEDLSRKAGLIIARRMLARIKLSKLYLANCDILQDSLNSSLLSHNSSLVCTTPKRKKRQKALRNSHDLVSARSRNIVVGRVSWPMDNSSSHEAVEPCDNITGVYFPNHAPLSTQGGFVKND